MPIKVLNYLREMHRFLSIVEPEVPNPLPRVQSQVDLELLGSRTILRWKALVKAARWNDSPSRGPLESWLQNSVGELNPIFSVDNKAGNQSFHDYLILVWLLDKCQTADGTILVVNTEQVRILRHVRWTGKAHVLIIGRATQKSSFRRKMLEQVLEILPRILTLSGSSALPSTPTRYFTYFEQTSPLLVPLHASESIVHKLLLRLESLIEYLFAPERIAVHAKAVFTMSPIVLDYMNDWEETLVHVLLRRTPDFVNVNITSISPVTHKMLWLDMSSRNKLQVLWHHSTLQIRVNGDSFSTPQVIPVEPVVNLLDDFWVDRDTVVSDSDSDTDNSDDMVL